MGYSSSSVLVKLKNGGVKLKSKNKIGDLGKDFKEDVMNHPDDNFRDRFLDQVLNNPEIAHGINANKLGGYFKKKFPAYEVEPEINSSKKPEEVSKKEPFPDNCFSWKKDLNEKEFLRKSSIRASEIEDRLSLRHTPQQYPVKPLEDIEDPTTSAFRKNFQEFINQDYPTTFEERFSTVYPPDPKIIEEKNLKQRRNLRKANEKIQSLLKDIDISKDESTKDDKFQNYYDKLKKGKIFEKLEELQKQLELPINSLEEHWSQLPEAAAPLKEPPLHDLEETIKLIEKMSSPAEAKLVKCAISDNHVQNKLKLIQELYNKSQFPAYRQEEIDLNIDSDLSSLSTSSWDTDMELTFDEYKNRRKQKKELKKKKKHRPKKKNSNIHETLKCGKYDSEFSDLDEELPFSKLPSMENLYKRAENAFKMSAETLQDMEEFAKSRLENIESQQQLQEKSKKLFDELKNMEEGTFESDDEEDNYKNSYLYKSLYKDY